MERVKNLKLPVGNRNRSPSIDMLVLDEVSKHVSTPMAPSPPISPRTQLTAPNLSTFIAQNTPPPSPKPSPKPDHVDRHSLFVQQHQNHNNHHVNSINNSNSSIFHTSPSHSLTMSGIFRNLSFNATNNSSMQSLITLENSLVNNRNSIDPIPNPSQQQNSNSTQQPHDVIEVKDGSKNSSTNNSPNSTPTTPAINSNNNTLRKSMIIDSGDPNFRKKKKENKTIKKLRKRVFYILNSYYWIAVMIVFILFILFIDDIIGISGSPSSHVQNSVIISLKLLVIFFFGIDIIGNLLVYQSQYFPGTIVFWLDFISMLSIIPDVIIYFSDHTLSSSYNALLIGRNARIIRICGSFVRMSLISAIYNRYLRRGNQTPKPSEGLEVEASKLGDKLIRLTTNKIVLLVLLVFFATQLLVYQSDNPSNFISSGIKSLDFMATTYGIKSDHFKNFYQSFLSENRNLNILSLTIQNTQMFKTIGTIDSIQSNAILKYNFGSSFIWLDNTYTLKISSIFHLCLTVFVIVVIIIINLLIVNDAHSLVINPLENVLAIVKFLSRQNAAAIQQNKTNNSLFKRERVESVGNKSEDTNSSSGLDEVEAGDEADYLLGMLNEIDDSLQAAKEKVEEESLQNSMLKKDIEDLYVEKYILQIHLRSLIRKIEFDDPIGLFIKKKQIMLASNIKSLPDGINSDDIKYKHDEANSDRFIVVSGSLDKLIERLSMPESHELKFANVFLLTFRKFISPIELMERLIIRFCVTPTMDLPEKSLSSIDTVEDWRKTKQEQIRISVFNTIKLWISKYNWDFNNNQELAELFNNLVHKIMPFCKMERYATHLETLYKRKMTTYITDRPYQPPKPLTSEEIAQMMVLEDRVLFNFEIHDISIQITLIEFELFRAIKPQEFLDLAWTSKNKTKLSPNICRFIDHFNNVSFWLQTLIVKSGKIKERVNYLKKIISLGEHFVALNNFNGAMEVLSSLESSAITRLHKTWELLPSSSLQSLQTLQKLLSPVGSFKEYREKLKQTTSACIPYIGIYLSDLTFIHEGNPDYKETLINFSKLREIAATIISIQQFQNTYYYYESNDKVKSQIDLKNSLDSEQIYKMSLTAEPRR
eukprot:gene9980-12232_t